MAKKRFPTPDDMLADWNEFKKECDMATVTRTEFSQKLADFVSSTIPAPVTYTVLGFCSWAGITRQDYYETYGKDHAFDTVIARISEECELDARRKFENGTLPTQLSGLWMSNYGYSTSQKADVSLAPVVIEGYGDIPD